MRLNSLPNRPASLRSTCRRDDTPVQVRQLDHPSAFKPARIPDSTKRLAARQLLNRFSSEQFQKRATAGGEQCSRPSGPSVPGQSSRPGCCLFPWPRRADVAADGRAGAVREPGAASSLVLLYE